MDTCTSFHRYTLFLLTLAGLFLSPGRSEGQVNSTNVSVRVVQVYAGRDDEGWPGKNNDYKWKIRADDRNAPGNCFGHSGGPGNFYANHTILYPTKYATIPTGLKLSMEVWEEDCGGGCDYNGRCPTLGIGFEDDDVHCGPVDAYFDLTAYLPGEWQSLPRQTICNGDYIIYPQIYFTPPVPALPTILVDGQPYNAINGPKCSDQTVQLITSSIGRADNTTYEWEYNVQGETYSELVYNDIYCGPCDNLGGRRPPCCDVPEYIYENRPLYRSYDNSTARNLSDILPNLTSNTVLTFRVRARAGSGVSDWSYATLQVSPAAPTFTLSAIPPTCKAGTDGKIVLNNIAGATNNYAFNVYDGGTIIGQGTCTNGSFTINAANTISLTANKTYGVKLLNRGGQAGVCNRELSILMPEPVIPDLTLALTSAANIFCQGGTDGVIEVTGSGGKGSYTYSISPGAISANATGTFNGLSAGTYTLTVRDECAVTATLGVTLTEPTRVTATPASVAVSCLGGSDGQVIVTAGNGSGRYSYWLYKGTALIDQLLNTTRTSWQVSSLRAGTDYRVELKDAQRESCPGDSKPFLISEPALLTLSLVSIRNIDCAGSNTGEVSLSAGGGNGGYTYSLAPANGSQSIGLPGQFTGLTAGSYVATVQDAKGCSQTVSFSITEPAAPLRLTLLEQRMISCRGADDGVIRVTASGGNGNYTYQWYYEGTLLSNTTPAITGGFPGAYTVVVRDDKGCQVQEEITLTEPDALTVAFTNISNISCSYTCDGTATASVTGGTAPYSYRWNDPAGQTTSQVTNLCPGTYTVQITDANGCSQSGQVTFAQPQPLTVELGGPYTLCGNQTLTLDAGVANMRYRWESANGFTSTDRVVTISQGGDYTLTVTSPQGCQASDNVTVTLLDQPFEVKFILPSQLSVGDTAKLVEISYPQPERLVWDYGPQAQVVNPDENEPEITFPEPGEYTIRLTAYLGPCSGSVSKTITFLPAGQVPSSGRVPLGATIKTIVVYPNPNNGQFEVQVVLNTAQDVQMAIFNLYGESLTSRTLQGSDTYQASFDIASQKKGVYYLRVSTAAETKAIRVAVQ